jgi:CHAT domain-containing protein
VGFGRAARWLLLFAGLALWGTPAFGQEPAVPAGSDDRLTEAEFREVADSLLAMQVGFGDHRQVELTARQLHTMVVESFGRDSAQALEVEWLIADATIRQSRFEEALQMARSIAPRANRQLDPDDLLLWRIFNLLVQATVQSGHAEEAQSLGADMLVEAEKRFGMDHFAALAIRLQMARAAQFLGQFETSRTHFTRIIEATARSPGNWQRQIHATALSEFGVLLNDSGKPEEALGPLNDAIAVYLDLYSVLKHPDMAPDVLTAVATKARALWYLERLDLLEDLVAPYLSRIEDVYGRDSSHWADFAKFMALADFGNGGDPVRAERGIALLREVEAIYAVDRSPQERFLLEARDLLGMFLAKTGRLEESLDVFGRTLENDALPRGDFYLYALALAARDGVWDSARAGEGVLDYLQVAHLKGAARAQALLNRRLAAGTGEAASVLRDVSDAETAISLVRKTLAAALSVPANERDRLAETALRERLKQLEESRNAIRQRMDAEYPSLAAVTGNSSLSKAEIQSLLGEDEALVILETGSQVGIPMALVLTRDSGFWYSIDTPPSNIAAAVEAIRSSVNLELNVRAARSRQKDKVDPAAFPLDAAHWLYRTLLGPAEQDLAGKSHVYFDLRGPVTAIPPGLLVASMPADDTAQPEWLVRRFAITVLPSTSALRTAGLGSVRQPALPVLAFADPVFAGTGNTAPSALRGALRPLPETADEAAAVVSALDASDGIRLGADASEAALKAMDLEDYRVLYFATHGLVAGDIAGTDRAPLAEPALALTAGGGEDGFLTASEIAQLRLAADWVVLSACNTALGAKPGAEPLSGLAQAFLYAGARALMVSHWPVESHSAVQLMTDLFRLRAEAPPMRAAEAHRQAILSMLDAPENPAWTHPAYWAPFILVGVPDRR